MQITNTKHQLIRESILETNELDTILGFVAEVAQEEENFLSSVQELRRYLNGNIEIIPEEQDKNY